MKKVSDLKPGDLLYFNHNRFLRGDSANIESIGRKWIYLARYRGRVDKSTMDYVSESGMTRIPVFTSLEELKMFNDYRVLKDKLDLAIRAGALRNLSYNQLKQIEGIINNE